MIIDKNYPGLIEKGKLYQYDGDIRTDKDLIVTIPLKCLGHIEAKNIKASGDLSSFKSIEVRNNIDVQGNIYVISCITAGGRIKAEGAINSNSYIRAEKYIEAGDYIYTADFLYAGEHIVAGDFIRASGRIDAGSYIIAGCYIQADLHIHTKKFIEATDYILAGDQIKAKEYVSLNGIKSKTFYNIIGKKWMITVMDTHIRIGCEFHSREKWADFSNAQLTLMGHGALTWWKENKEWVLSLK